MNGRSFFCKKCPSSAISFLAPAEEQGAIWAPLVYEYYDEGFDNRKNPNVIVQRTEGGPKGPPQSSAQ